MDEGGCLCRYAVVSAAPGREVQLARLARTPTKVLHKRRYGFRGQKPPEELGFAVGMTLRLVIRALPEPIVLAGHGVAEFGQVALGIPVGHLLIKRRCRVRAYPDH